MRDDRNIHVSPERIRELADDQHSHLLVIEGEQRVCGTAFLTICLDPMYGFQPYGVVENVVLSTGQRGLGFGRALMAAIEEQARRAQCTKLMLLSATSRVDAHGFFAAMGFDAAKKRGFIKYLNRTETLRSSA